MTGRPVKLLFDEHVWEGLTQALAQRGYDVVHVANTLQRGMDDESLLDYAASRGRVVLTYNIRHFVPLIAEWYEAHRALVARIQVNFSAAICRVNIFKGAVR
jgi:hypothetical protein